MENELPTQKTEDEIIKEVSKLIAEETLDETEKIKRIIESSCDCV